MRHCKGLKKCGAILAALGVIIILALVLPSFVWWFVLAGALICCGISLLIRC